MQANNHDMPFTPASRVRGIEPYQPPAAARPIRLALDANEGPPPDASLLRLLGAVDPESIRRYPNPGGLEARIAARWEVDPSRIVVTNGADDAIDRVCRATLEPGRTLLTHAPSFEMIPRAARLAGADVRAVPWLDEPFPLETLLAKRDSSTSLIALVSPNNPTGRTIEAGAMRTIADAARVLGAIVLIDLAYVDFTDDDPTTALLDCVNVVIVRTFSKAYGLAGLRVGCAIAPASIATSLRAVGGPYPVSSISLTLASAALDQPDATRRTYIDQVRRERTALEALLHERDAAPIPSQANFVSARFQNAAAMRDALARRAVAVRGFSPESGFGDYLRISLPGDEKSFALLAAALCESFDELAASNPSVFTASEPST